MPTRRTTILADTDLLERTERFADRARTTKTAVIAAALEAYLAAHDATPSLRSWRSVGAATDGCRSTDARLPGGGRPAPAGER
jgi:hypothetical protein